MNITFGVNPTGIPVSLQSVAEMLENEFSVIDHISSSFQAAIKAARSRVHQRAALSVRIEDGDQQSHFAPSFTADLALSFSVPVALVSHSPPLTGRRK